MTFSTFTVCACHLSAGDQAFFIFDHLEGEAKEEIKYQPSRDQRDPERSFAILKELYGCDQSYVTLQQAFFSRQQQEGESLQEFLLALMALMEQIKQRAPDGMLNVEVLLRDQVVEHVGDSGLLRELKQFIHPQPMATLLEVCSEAIQWEGEGLLGGTRARCYSFPSACGLQFNVQGHPHGSLPPASLTSELGELKQLTQTVASFQNAPLVRQPSRQALFICIHCQ